jgi:hypothetical protein
MEEIKFNLPQYIIENYLYHKSYLFLGKLEEYLKDVEYFSVKEICCPKDIFVLIKYKNKFIDILGIYDEKQLINRSNTPHRTKTNYDPQPIQCLKDSYLCLLKKDKVIQNIKEIQNLTSLAEKEECDYFFSVIKNILDKEFLMRVVPNKNKDS